MTNVKLFNWGNSKAIRTPIAIIHTYKLLFDLCDHYSKN